MTKLRLARRRYGAGIEPERRPGTPLPRREGLGEGRESAEKPPFSSPLHGGEQSPARASRAPTVARCLRAGIFASILLTLPGCAVFDAWSKPPADEPLKPLHLRVHLASGDRRSGMELQADERGLPVFVAPEPLATERNVNFASVADNARQHLVLLYFTPDAAERLAEATRAALRGARGAARLAVFLEDKLVMSGYLKAPVADGRLFLDGDFSARRAAEIANRLNAYRAAMFRDPPPD